MTGIRLTLPYPPSANRYWRNWNGRMIVSKEARQYKKSVALENSRVKPLDGEVLVSITIFRPTLQGDLDNRLKVLLDAIKGVAFHDDKQVAAIHARRLLDRENPRAEVRIESLQRREK